MFKAITLLVRYLQYFIFFVTYKLAISARVFHYIRLGKLARDKQSSFVHNSENKVMWVRLLRLSITAFNIMSIIITSLYSALSISINQPNTSVWNAVMLSAVMLDVVMMSDVALLPLPKNIIIFCKYYFSWQYPLWIKGRGFLYP